MTTEPTRKTWGISIPIFRDSFFQIEKIEVYAGGFSSIHFHRHKQNRFIVESGRLIVREFIRARVDPECNEWDCIKEHDLRMGDDLLIGTSTVHSFHAAERTTGLEIYYTRDGSEVDPEDIERFSDNGVSNQPEEQVDTETARICAGCWKHLEARYKPEYEFRESNGAMRPFCHACINQFQLES